jgi:hypothetical protein
MYSSSKSESAQNTLTGTDQARLLGDRAAYVETGGLNLGGTRSKYLQTGSTDLAQAKINSAALSGSKITAQTGSTINIGDVTGEGARSVSDTATALASVLGNTTENFVTAFKDIFTTSTASTGAAQSAFADTLKAITADSSQAMQKAFGSQATQLSSTLGAISELSESRQTEGMSSLAKQFLYLAGGLGAVLLLALLIFRKK